MVIVILDYLINWSHQLGSEELSDFEKTICVLLFEDVGSKCEGFSMLIRSVNDSRSMLEQHER